MTPDNSWKPIAADPVKDLRKEAQRIIEIATPRAPYAGMQFKVYLTGEGKVRDVETVVEFDSPEFGKGHVQCSYSDNPYDPKKVRILRRLYAPGADMCYAGADLDLDAAELEQILTHDRAAVPRIFFAGTPEDPDPFLLRPELAFLELYGKDEKEVERFDRKHRLSEKGVLRVVRPWR